jgi:hypothetical protein
MMLSGVNYFLFQDFTCVRDKKIIRSAASEMLKPDLPAGSAEPGQEGARGASVQIYAERELLSAEPMNSKESG